MASQNSRVRSLGPVRPTSDPNEVDALSTAYQRMAYLWDPIMDLLGKTTRMRLAREKWLPQETNETTAAYEARLFRSFLFGALSDTIDKVVSKPFAEPVILVGETELPDQLQDIEDDVDLCGMDLSTFGAQTFADGVTHGLTFCLVDYPDVEIGLNLGQVLDQRIRPYFTIITADNLIGFRSHKAKNGAEVLDEIRYMTTRTIHDGEFGDREQRIIRQIFSPVVDGDGQVVEDPETGSANRGQWFIWVEVDKKDSKDKWVLDEEGSHTYPGIPLVVGYLEKVGFMEAVPPFEDLAWKNIEHWQKSSDHNNILRFSRFGLLFGSGFDEDRIEAGITIGPNRLIVDPNPEAKLTYVDSSGSVGAIGLGTEDLKRIEDQMEVLGMQPFLRPSGNIKATGQAIGAAKTHSAIQQWIRRHEAFLEQCYRVAAIWIDVELPEDFGIKIHSEFAIGLVGSEDMKIIDTARARKDLDRTTWIEEAKRRGVLAENVDPETVEERLDDEGEALGTIGLEEDEDAEEEEGDGTEGQGDGTDEEGKPEGLR